MKCLSCRKTYQSELMFKLQRNGKRNRMCILCGHRKRQNYRQKKETLAQSSGQSDFMMQFNFNDYNYVGIPIAHGYEEMDERIPAYPYQSDAIADDTRCCYSEFESLEHFE